MLPNGSILVVGGETGSNAPAEPSLEILPRPPGGDTYLNMDWLQRTDPNNLYPFIFVLPGGGIFIGQLDLSSQMPRDSPTESLLQRGSYSGSSHL